MLNNIAISASEHVANHAAAFPFIFVLVTFLGAGFIYEMIGKAKR